MFSFSVITSCSYVDSFENAFCIFHCCMFVLSFLLSLICLDVSGASYSPQECGFKLVTNSIVCKF